MKLLEERILRDGIVKEGNVLKVDCFLNHQMDCALFVEMANEWRRLFADSEINKILTIEASGIGLASIAGLIFQCPVVFAKKNRTLNIASDVFKTKVESYTHKTSYNVIVSQQYLGADDRVLLIDDFLANGAALDGLIDLCRQANAKVIGAGIAIEKAFQPGGERIRSQGVRVESLARIASMENGNIVFMT